MQHKLQNNNRINKRMNKIYQFSIDGAAVELSPEGLNSHDGKDKPKDEDHYSNIADCRESKYQSVYHNLQ